MLGQDYNFTTTFQLMQPINADNSGLHYVWVIALFELIMCELLSFLDFEIFVKFFVHPRN